MIQLQDVNVIFSPHTLNENHVLKNINLKIAKGDFISVIGSNGAGKSTLMNIIAGSIALSSGSIYFDRRSIARLAEYKRARFIGRVYQDPLLGTAGNLSIEHNMLLAQKKGMKLPVISLNKQRRQEFRKLLLELDMGLEERLQENMNRLSGGQRQALSLLMLAHSNPKIALLDEHTAALDPYNAEKILELTTIFIARYKLTTMMITHNMQHAIDFGNRLLMLDKGEIILDISGKEKEDLTVHNLVNRFRELRKQEYIDDRDLLNN